MTTKATAVTALQRLSANAITNPNSDPITPLDALEEEKASVDLRDSMETKPLYPYFGIKVS